MTDNFDNLIKRASQPVQSSGQKDTPVDDCEQLINEREN